MSDVQEKERDEPLTRVTKLKIGGDWDWNVSYIQTFQELTVHTNDSPRDTLSTAIANVTKRALAYFKIDDVSVLLDTITFADGEKGPTFSLILNARPSGNPYCRMKWTVSKIDRDIKFDHKTNEDAKGFYERNRLNEAVDVLEEEIRKYALGDRLQKKLDLEEESPIPSIKQGIFDIMIDGTNEFKKAIEEAGGKFEVNTDPEVIEVDFASREAARK